MNSHKYKIHLGYYEYFLEITKIDRAEKVFAACEMLRELSFKEV